MMKRKKKKQAKKSKLTLAQVVKAATEAGARVSVGLVPIGSGVEPIQSMVKPGVEKAVAWINDLAKQPERPRLDLPLDKLPGSPYNRSLIASMDYTRRDVEKAFKDDPSSLWVITPYEIFERKTFFAPPKEQSTPKPQSTPNPS